VRPVAPGSLLVLLRYPALVIRRRQLIDMLTVEKDCLRQANAPTLKKIVRAHICWLEKQLGEVDDHWMTISGKTRSGV